MSTRLCAEVTQKCENGGTNKSGPRDSLRKQGAGFLGPRPTPLGAPNFG